MFSDEAEGDSVEERNVNAISSDSELTANDGRTGKKHGNTT